MAGWKEWPLIKLHFIGLDTTRETRALISLIREQAVINTNSGTVGYLHTELRITFRTPIIRSRLPTIATNGVIHYQHVFK